VASISTSRKKQSIYIRNNPLRLFREIIALCRQEHKYMNGGSKVILININITAGGFYIYHWDFSG
jgi:hypothetical protein